MMTVNSQQNTNTNDIEDPNLDLCILRIYVIGSARDGIRDQWQFPALQGRELYARTSRSVLSTLSAHEVSPSRG